MIKNFLRTALLLSFSVTTFVSKAQKSDSTVTIIFAGDRSKTSKTTKRKAAPQNNIIKVAPTGIFVGQIPLIYERKLTSSISVQLSAGLTAQNYIRTLFAKASQIASDGSSSSSNLPWADKSSNSDYAEDIYNFERRKAEMGTMFSIQPKFYLDDDALDGSYVGFSYSNYNYKFSTPKAVYTTTAYSNIIFTGAPQNESEKITDFMIHYGHQGINGHFSIEYSSAIGLRKVSGEKYGATYDYNVDKTHPLDGMIQYSKTLFNYEFAIRVGYVF